jgi:DNA-binding transcriptional ArsR family regulator
MPTTWGFLTNHARAMLFIAQDPDARLRDLAEALGVTERTAFGLVADLTEAGYVVKEREGRRNRYHIRPDLPLRHPINRERTIGELLNVLLGSEEQERSGRPT